MNEKDAWNRFFLTGSVTDYLNFKAIELKNKESNKSENENIHQRTDNKTTEYR